MPGILTYVVGDKVDEVKHARRIWSCEVGRGNRACGEERIVGYCEVNAKTKDVFGGRLPSLLDRLWEGGAAGCYGKSV